MVRYLCAYFIILGLVIFAGSQVFAQTIEASWDMPTTRTDGQAISPAELKHTKIRWVCPAESGELLAPSPATVQSVEINSTGLCRFYASVEDLGGLWSAESEEKTIVLSSNAPPRPPTWIELVIAFFKKIFGWFV